MPNPLKTTILKLGSFRLQLTLTREPPPVPSGTGNWLPLTRIGDWDPTSGSADPWDACIDDLTQEMVLVHLRCDARSENGRCVFCGMVEPDAQGEWYDEYRNQRQQWFAGHNH